MKKFSKIFIMLAFVITSFFASFNFSGNVYANELTPVSFDDSRVNKDAFSEANGDAVLRSNWKNDLNFAAIAFHDTGVPGGGYDVALETSSATFANVIHIRFNAGDIIDQDYEKPIKDANTGEKVDFSEDGGNAIYGYLNVEFSYKITLVLYVENPNGEIYAPANSEGLFKDLSRIQQMFLTEFNTSLATTFNDMFNGCKALGSVDLSTFNTSNVTDMRRMFRDCQKLGTIDVATFDTRKVTDMAAMFDFCYAVQKLDVSNFETALVTEMALMFRDNKLLKELDVSNFDTSSVTGLTSFHDMFSGCTLIESLDVSSFTFNSGVVIRYMFRNMTSLKYLNMDVDLSVINADINGMLYGVNNLDVFIAPNAMLPTISISIPSSLTKNSDGTVITSRTYNQAYITANGNQSQTFVSNDTNRINFTDTVESTGFASSIWTYKVSNKLTFLTPEITTPGSDKFFYGWEIAGQTYLPNQTITINAPSDVDIAATAVWKNAVATVGIDADGDHTDVLFNSHGSNVTEYTINSSGYYLKSVIPSGGANFYGFQYETSNGSNIWYYLDQGAEAKTDDYYTLDLNNIITDEFIRNNFYENGDNLSINFRALYTDEQHLLSIKSNLNNGTIRINNNDVGMIIDNAGTPETTDDVYVNENQIAIPKGELINLDAFADEYYDIQEIIVRITTEEPVRFKKTATQSAIELFNERQESATPITMTNDAEIEVVYKINTYNVSYSAKTNNGGNVSFASVMTTNSPTSFVKADSLNVSGYTAIDADESSEFVFTKWTYADGTDISYDKTLNTNVSLDKLDSDNEIKIVAVFERRYLLEVNTTGSETFTLTYTNFDYSQVTTTASTTTQVYVFEDREVRVNITKSSITPGEQISVNNSTNISQSDIIDNTVIVRELEDKNTNYKSVTIGFEALSYKITVFNVDEYGSQISSSLISGNYNITSNNDINNIVASDTITFALSANQPAAADYRFERVYTINSNGDKDVIFDKAYALKSGSDTIANMMDSVRVVGDSNVLNVYYEYYRQATLNLNIDGAYNTANGMGTVTLLYTDAFVTDEQVTDLTRKYYDVNTQFKITVTPAVNHFLARYEGVSGSGDGERTFTLTGGVKDVYIEFSIVTYEIVINYVDQDGLIINSIVDENHTLTLTRRNGNTVAFGDDVAFTYDYNTPLDAKEYRLSEIRFKESGVVAITSKDPFIHPKFDADFIAEDVDGDKVIVIEIEYIEQKTIRLDVQNGANDEMGNVVATLDKNSNTTINLETEQTFDIYTKVYFKVNTANKHYSLLPVEGVVDNVEENVWVEETLRSDSKVITIKFEPKVYTLKINHNEGGFNGKVEETVKEVSIGDSITLILAPKSTYELFSWKIDGKEIERQGDTITLDITESFLNSYDLTNNTLTLESEIETIMNRTLFYGLIFGSITLAAAAGVVVLLVLRSKKMKKEKQDMQKRLEEFSKKFNISSTISDLKKK